jgi:hypothetical protein
VERITQVVLDSLPSLWKLGQLYYPEVAKSSQREANRARRRSTILAETTVVEADEGLQEARAEQIRGFVVAVTNTFSGMVEANFLAVWTCSGE